MTRYLLAFVLAFSLSGCQLLFPAGPNGPRPAPTPDKTDPDVGLTDKFEIRKRVGAVADKIPEAPLLQLYGVTSGMATYLTSQSNQFDDIADVTKRLEATLNGVGWSKGAYPEWNAEITKIFDEVGFGESGKKVTDTKADLINTFRLISAGCRDALARK